ncbi:putative C6 transcription factor [Aspergillus avenaceus]|uniref:Putative C6 transcription factor n=1 Tax=Aspergillus avenaceus TaxID=36643 RepID=A0A5N6TG59_ASPAV|nr:putative C6 transcription factor [Aspergillus avenaceus]
MASRAVRRNGTLQSCEPCRKSKLRCDHARPVCGRCVTKKITARCYYHPAPMTKGVRSPAGTSHPDTGARNRRLSSLSSSSKLGIGASTSLEVPGYLGATSYSAVLAEHQRHHDHSDVVFGAGDRGGVGTPMMMDSSRLRASVELLRVLYDYPVYDVLIWKLYSRKSIVVVPHRVTEAVIRSLRAAFAALDGHADLDVQLQDLVCLVSRNTCKPLVAHAGLTVEEYCASFTGGNLRWEAVGIVLSLSGIAILSTSDDDQDLMQAAPASEARSRLRAQIVDASNACLNFCDQASLVNELLGFAQYQDVMLKTQYYGDSSYQAWRRLGDLSATIYAAGLHQDNPQDDTCPFFLRQWRRICFASAFYADKALATFAGRPPLINYRYCTLTPPIDLDEEALVAGGEALDAALSNLDAQGWNTQTQNFRVSMLRLRFIFSVFRDQALEMALGTYEDWDLIQKSDQIIKEARATFHAAPAFIRYDIQVEDHDTESYASSFPSLHMYLHYLYTIFILQRVLVKRTNTGHQALFDTARQALSIVIRIGSECDQSMDLNRHYTWLILYYGLPSASVLTLELLHQTQELSTHAVSLPRAEIIRNLSVFLSCLSWVPRPTHGNYHTCKEAEKTLSHILDQIIDPQPILRESFDDVTSGLHNFLDWYNPNSWDFNAESLPFTDGFSLPGN